MKRIRSMEGNLIPSRFLTVQELESSVSHP